MKIAGLNIHPLKSGRAIAVPEVMVLEDGLESDRRFMLVDPDGQFITQRELQSLARVDAHTVSGGVRLSMDGKSLTALFDPAQRMSVVVWDSPVDAAVAADDVNAKLSSWFSRPVRLVHMDALSHRTEGEEWTGGIARPVGFADGFSILITTTASLDDLNRTLAELGEEPVGMERFRTNILIENDIAWEEDLWESVEIGGIAFDLVKPCARCIMTTQDQQTGERTGGNPIAGLAVKRMSADRRVPGVLFGWNAIPRGTGCLRVGDLVGVVSLRDARWPMKRRSA